MREPQFERPHPASEGGIQKVYRFPNGYGASVVRHSFSYGGEDGFWELAVVQFTSEDILDFQLTYATPITNDVLGWLDEDEVDERLTAIEQLPTGEANVPAGPT